MKKIIYTLSFLICAIFMHATGAEYIISEAIRHVVDSVTPDNGKGHTATSVKTSSSSGITESKTNKKTLKAEAEQQKEIEPKAVAANKDDFASYLYHLDWKSLLLKIIKIFFIIFCSWLLWDISNRMAQGYIKKVRLFKKVSSHTSRNTQALIKTISPIIRSIFHWILIILTILMILSEFVNITPIFFSFGIVGIAFTIGSQTLMKDLVNGILMLFEGNVAVGDVVTIGSRAGTVESLSLRTLSLRHFTGEIQTIPLSEVTSLINCSRDFSVAVVQFIVEPKAKISDIEMALSETYQSMKKDSHFGSYITAEMSSLGVRQMSEIGVQMSTTIPIIPDPRKRFLPEFNKRLYERLQAYDVPLAYNGTASTVYSESCLKK
ncbi:MAG: mechanosensitive ion channel [Candidatus Paracaedibacteraceae bacterium]|nr:mechanosensitive ion channel [Candidatus Paracaedibacteraceae bacterium]